MAKKEEKNVETKKNNKKHVHEVVIKIDGEAWTKALDQAFKKKQKTAKVDGFRKYLEIFMKNTLVKSLYLSMQLIVYYKMLILKLWKSLS